MSRRSRDKNDRKRNQCKVSIERRLKAMKQFYDAEARWMTK